MEKVKTVIEIKSNKNLKMSPDGDFFKCWVVFTKPLHELTKREMGVLAAFLKERYQLSKHITDSELLDSVLMSKETKSKIRNACGVSAKYFQVIMSKFRRNGVIINNRIIPKLIPEIDEDGAFLMIYFNLNYEEHPRIDL